MNEIVAKGTILPSPTEIGTSDELIWSSGTGRNASGNMVGDLIAQKKTIAIKWGILTKADMKKIESPGERFLCANIGATKTEKLESGQGIELLQGAGRRERASVSQLE